MKKKVLLCLFLLFVLLTNMVGCSRDSGGALLDDPDFFSPDTESTDSKHELPAGASLSVHFLDVGQADAALVLCAGEAMLIDGGNTADSQFLYSYLDAQGIDHLDYVVCTHAHEDHVGGLAAALNACTADVIYAPVQSYESKAFHDFLKYAAAQDISVTVPEPGSQFDLGSAEVQILGPQKEYEEPNNTSLVLRVVFGEASFLFTGDAEREAEQDMIDAGVSLSSTVLKVGHHGSDTSTSYVFLRGVMPEYAVISVGEGNSYGHPDDAVLSRLRDAGAAVYRTDMQGTIVAESDGESVAFATEKNPDAHTNPTEDDGSGQNGTTPGPGDEPLYIGNKNTKKFHLPSCSYLPEEKNQVAFNSREEAIEEGFDPCKKCNP